jgi:sulfopyruvate decarboxylase subunit alpha
MIAPEHVTRILDQLEVTHLVWVPDSVMGRWEEALDGGARPLIRVCREGEAWPLAAGLHAGGASPLILMQSTGLFESGDALRNAVFDLRLPLYAWIGIRNWLHPDSSDSARHFAPRMIEAWQLDHVWIECDEDWPRMVEHYEACRRAGRAGVALLAEGAG